jgi:anti-sigma regulatory factor (Ser/Thr protein kinase)
LELDLANSVDAAAEARRALDRLSSQLPVRRLHDLRLLVSELVTNAVRHADLAEGDPIHLRVDTHDAMLRVEVRDGGKGFAAGAPDPQPKGPSGWGLYLVAELADRWGVDQDDGRPGTRIWFELDR